MIKSLALFSFGMKWVEGLVFEVLKLSEKKFKSLAQIIQAYALTCLCQRGYGSLSLPFLENSILNPLPKLAHIANLINKLSIYELPFFE